VLSFLSPCWAECWYFLWPRGFPGGLADDDVYFSDEHPAQYAKPMTNAGCKIAAMGNRK
jgi:hypothetical protein